jgi:hypothetical protein
MNEPDIESVDEVKTLHLESVNVWKNYKKRIPSRISTGATDRSGTHRTEVMFTLNSQDLSMWSSMISSRMISETEEQTIERLRSE